MGLVTPDMLACRICYELGLVIKYIVLKPGQSLWVTLYYSKI